MFTSLSFSLVDVLPLIKNKGEATVLIAVIILSQKLTSASRMLNLSVENELLFIELQKLKYSLFEVAVRPVLSNSILLLKERFQFQVTTFSNLLEDLCRINSSLQQYGEQNMALGKELALANCAELSKQKQNVAHLELELCRRISIIKDFSRGNVLQRALLQPFQFEPLSIENSKSSAESEVLKSGKSNDVIVNNNLIGNCHLLGDSSIDKDDLNHPERKRKVPASDHDDNEGNISKKRINELSTTCGFSPSNCFTQHQLLQNETSDKNIPSEIISYKVDVAVDTSEMSPPVELVRTDTSTPTSSQTVFSGDEGIRDHIVPGKCERISAQDVKSNNVLRDSLSSSKSASDSKVVQTSSTSTQYSQNQSNLFRTSVNSPSISYIQQGRLFDTGENVVAMVNSPSLSEAGSDGSQLLSEQQEQNLNHPVMSRFSTIMRRQTQ